jgi:hypothetical protein
LPGVGYGLSRNNLKKEFLGNVYPNVPRFALMGRTATKIYMHDVTRDFLVSIAAFATLFGIIYVFVITRYRERMSMLEKGVDPSLFASRSKGAGTLKGGMVCVGIALGLLMGNVLYNKNILDETVAYFSMIFLFGGISLIVNFLIEQRLKR